MKDNFVWGEISNEELAKKQKRVISQLIVDLAYYKNMGTERFEWMCADNSCKKCKDKSGIYKVEKLENMIFNMHKQCEYEYCRCCIVPAIS